MALAYYAHAATEKHWTDVWQKNQLEQLLDVARGDPLSVHLKDHLKEARLVIEGGCGLGQYVPFFEQHGYRMIGGDYSLAALQIHKLRYPQSPLVGLDLLHMPCADNTFDAHISIGVVEHLVDGPQPIIREMYRTLRPGGILLLTVPWINGYRQLNQSRIRHRQVESQATGVPFYQYAYSKSEIRTFLTEERFQVQAFYPYSPAKGMREAKVLRQLQKMRQASLKEVTGQETGFPNKKELETQEVNATMKPVAGLRKTLYWPPVLNFFAHMILAVAHKPA